MSFRCNIDDQPGDSEITTDNNEAFALSRLKNRNNHQVVIVLTILVTVTIIVSILTGLIRFINPGVFRAENAFQYQVHMQDGSTSEDIYNAKITIEMADIAPVDAFTDSNGYVRMVFDVKHIGGPAKIIVEAVGYQDYEQIIDLTRISLPDVIRLNAIP